LKKDALMFFTLLDHLFDVATPMAEKPTTAIARRGSAAARILGVVVVAALACGSAPAWADWNVGEPYKMHFPQLPDPNGWDINITGTSNLVADDWQCTQTGPVSDIHFWYSVQGDDANTSINSLTATIYSDIPVSGTTVPFSRPGSLLWSGTFGEGAFTSRFFGSGNYVLYGHSKFAEQGLVVGRGTKVLDRYRATEAANILRPTEAQACFDRDAGANRGRKNQLAVFGGLLFEPLEARSRNHAGGYTLGFEGFASGNRQLHLGAGCDQDHFWLAVASIG
jgi:hypothetical protein